MNPIEDRLRAAFSAQAEQLTEGKLDRLAADRQAANRSEDDLERGEPTVTLPRLDELAARRSRTHRWVGPSIAAAAVVALAAGVIGLAASRHGTEQASPAGPSNSQTAPTHKPSMTPSSTPTSTDTTQSSGHTELGFLSAGQTGQRSEVPWSKVGAGWRLIQPANQKALYLYDPADGRYLISDQLAADATVKAWSPDGRNAALQLPDRIDQIDLHTGAISPIVGGRVFVAYTRPRGLAVLVTGAESMQRYGTDGTLQLTYDNNMNGIGALVGSALYTADGSSFVVNGADRAFLISNSGDPLQSYNIPAGMSNCRSIRFWNATTFLEWCSDSTGGFHLYLQPATGGAAQPLMGPGNLAATQAWPLSNGDVVVELSYMDCNSNGYIILHPDGSTTPLRLPAGVPSPGHILSMSGDIATFTLAKNACAGGEGTIAYNMVTGLTTPEPIPATAIISYPQY